MTIKWLKVCGAIASVACTVAGAVQGYFERKSADVKLTEKINEIIDARLGKES